MQNWRNLIKVAKRSLILLICYEVRIPQKMAQSYSYAFYDQSLRNLHRVMESESAKPQNIEDIFDSSLNLEETHVQEGFKDGFNDGLVSGKQEGKEVGLKLGFEVGEELGFYRGCIDVWNSAIQVDSGCFSSRVQKSIKQMEELIEKYPILDPENESVQEIMDALRLKFRSISATLSMKLEYDGYPKSSEVEFWFLKEIIYSFYLFQLGFYSYWSSVTLLIFVTYP